MLTAQTATIGSGVAGAITVSGTGFLNGTYVIAGICNVGSCTNSTNYYQSPGVGYIWYTSGYWIISSSLGVQTNNYFAAGSVGTAPFALWTAQNGAGGSETTTDGSGGILTIDNSANVTTGGVLSVKGTGNSYILGNVGIGETANRTKLVSVLGGAAIGRIDNDNIF